MPKKNRSPKLIYSRGDLVRIQDRDHYYFGFSDAYGVQAGDTVEVRTADSNDDSYLVSPAGRDNPTRWVRYDEVDPDFDPVTKDELAEVYESLGVRPQETP